MPTFADFLSTVKGPIGEKPLLAIWDVAPNHMSLVGGIPDMRRYYLDVNEKLRVQLLLQERFPEALILPGVWPDLGAATEAPAFGGQVTWFKDQAPYVSPSKVSLTEIDHWKLPQPGNSGFMPLFLVQLKQMRDALQVNNIESGKIVIGLGPADLAGSIFGYDQFFLALHDDPERVSVLLEQLSGFIIAWLRLQEAVIGEAELMILVDHVPSQVSPKHLEALILPHIRRIFGAYPNAVRMYHNEGFHSDAHIQLVQEFGFNVWHFGSDKHDLSSLYARLKEDVCLFGGLNPHGVLRTGTPQQVKEETLACLHAARGRRLILSSGTGTTPDVPPENVRSFITTALEATID